jgi:UDP-N-acetylmuramoylalanine--D-glutamate ligase
MAKNTYIVLGYGRSGRESEKHLLSQGYSVIVYDDSQMRTPHINWAEVTTVVQSPGIPSSHPISLAAKTAGLPICTDIDLLQKRSPTAHYIGITGTNGKSTTTALIGHILKQAGLKVEVGGNIGIPALSLKDVAEDGWYVLELSSYQLELSNDLNLDIAVWLNISPDHLDRHGTIENYIDAKKRIFNHAKWACISIDDKYSKLVSNQLSVPHKTIASEFKNYPADVWIDASGMLHSEGVLFDCNELETLKGTHNWQNVALAFAAARQVVNTPQEIWKHIQTFPGLAHRQQRVIKTKHVEFINDSKATNADACEKALKTYIGQNIFWILGGVAKTDGIDLLTPYFPYIKKAYLIGEAQDRFANTLKDIVAFEKCPSLEAAVCKANADANVENNAVVLLSPACASFDQFRDYEHRGEEFIQIVRKIHL